jgi:hypothetical protein
VNLNRWIVPDSTHSLTRRQNGTMSFSLSVIIILLTAMASDGRTTTRCGSLAASPGANRKSARRPHAPANVYQVRQSQSNGAHARTAKFDKRFRSFEFLIVSVRGRDGLETETSRSRDVSRRIQGLVSVSSRNILYRLGLVSVSRFKVSDLVSVSAFWVSSPSPTFGFLVKKHVGTRP